MAEGGAGGEGARRGGKRESGGRARSRALESCCSSGSVSCRCLGREGLLQAVV